MRKHTPRKIVQAGWYVGAGIAFLMFGLPPEWLNNAPTRGLFCLLGVMCLGGAAYEWWFRKPTEHAATLPIPHAAENPFARTDSWSTQFVRESRERDEGQLRRKALELEVAEKQERLRQAKLDSGEAEEELKLKRYDARPVVLPELVYAGSDDSAHFALYVRNVGTRTAREVLVSAMVIGSHHMTFAMIQILTPSDNGKEVCAHVYQPTINAYGPGNHISFNDAIRSVENVYLTGHPRIARVVADQVVIPFTITYTDAHAGTEYSEAHELVFADPEVHVISWLVRASRKHGNKLK